MKLIYKILFIVIGFSITTSSFAQEFTDKEIGFDVKRIEASLKANGVADQYVQQEISMMRDWYLHQYIKEQKLEKEIQQNKQSVSKQRLEVVTTAALNIPQSEKNALIAIYNATGGANWTNTTGNSYPWPVSNPDADVVAWYGVGVSNGHVVSLNLQNNNLIGTIPVEIGNLPNLTYLSFNNNSLTGSVPSQIGQLTNLTSLNLSRNQLSGALPSQFYNLIKLEFLDLNNNQFSGAISSQLGQLVKLKVVNITSNSFSGPIPTQIGLLTDLISFAAGVNQLSGSIPVEFCQLTNLTEVYLSSNQLTGSIPSQINQLTNVTGIYLNVNKLSGELPSEIGSMTNLTTLYLNNNQFSGTVPTSYGNLVNLNILSLHTNNLTGSLPVGMQNFDKLTTLFLSDNKFSGAIPNLTAAINLRRVQFQGNKFRFVDFENQYSLYKSRFTTTFDYAPQAKTDAEFSGTANVFVAQHVTFCMECNGGYTGTETFQWFKGVYPNGIAINATPSVANRLLDFPSLTLADAGDYYCLSKHPQMTDPAIVGGSQNLILVRENFHMNVAACTTVLEGEISVNDCIGGRSILAKSNNCEYTCGERTVYLSFPSELDLDNLDFQWIVRNPNGITLPPSSSHNPTFALTLPGTYTVELTIFDDDACPSIFTKTITVVDCHDTCDIHFNFNFKLPSTVKGGLLNNAERENIANGIIDFVNSNVNNQLYLTTYDDHSSGVRTTAVQTKYVSVFIPATTNAANETQGGFFRFQDDFYSDTFKNIITNPANGIVSNPAITKKIDISFFVISEDRFANMSQVMAAYNQLVSSSDVKKVFFILVGEGLFKNLGTGTSLTPAQFVAQLKGTSVAVDYANVSSVLNSDYIVFSKSQIAGSGFKDTLKQFLNGAYNEAKLKACNGSCTITNPRTQTVKNLLIALVNHLSTLPASTVVNGYTCPQLTALKPYISDPNPKIYNFHNYSGWVSFSFSNHPGTELPDVGGLGGILTPLLDLDLMLFTDGNSYTSVGLSTQSGVFNYPYSYNRHSVRHINFCPSACTPVEGSIITSNVCPTGPKKIASCDYTCGDRKIGAYLSSNIDDVNEYTFQWTIKNPSGAVIYTDDDYEVTYTLTTPGFNTIELVITDPNGCQTSFGPDKVYVKTCESCTATNPRTPLVLKAFQKLLYHLHQKVINNEEIPEGYECEELYELRPYLTDGKEAAIYNFHPEPFSFSFHPVEKGDEKDQDVLLDSWPNEDSEIESIDLSNYTNAADYTNLDEKVIFTDKNKTIVKFGFVRHVDFCPEELCVNHVAIVVDESGSIDVYEKAKIKRQLRWFVKQQAAINDNEYGNMHISLIGMADSDVSNRTDNILSIRPTAQNTSPGGQFDDWINNYGNRNGTLGVSGGSDFWKSGLDVALAAGASKKLDMVIMITDGSQTARPDLLQETLQKFNNTSLHYPPVSPAKPHLYVIGIDNGFYVDNPTATNMQLPRAQDPNYVPTLKKTSVAGRVTPSLALSLKYLLKLTGAEFPFSDIADFGKDYFGHSDFSFIGEDINEFYLSNKIKKANIGCRNEVVKNDCDACFSFQPIPGMEYVLSAWAKEELNNQVKTYTNPKIKLNFLRGDKELILKNDGTSASITFDPKGDIIEGWQRIGNKFKVPFEPNDPLRQTAYIEFELINASNSMPVYFDDIRIYPIDGSMKSFVYDPENFRLMSELDENNYATYYEYDNEGGLVRIKKETVKGIKTIQETRSGNVIKVVE